MGTEMVKAAEASGYFWQKPRFGQIGQIKRPDHQYSVGQFYRGGKSIITEKELHACQVIIKAYRKYKSKSKQDHNYELTSDF